MEAKLGQAKGCSAECRCWIRYEVRAPVIFSWRDEQGNEHQGAGFTRDISVKGFFCLSSSPPPQGMAIAVEIVLPLAQVRNQGLGVQTDARVIRVGEAENLQGLQL